MGGLLKCVKLRRVRTGFKLVERRFDLWPGAAPHQGLENEITTVSNVHDNVAMC